MCGNRKCCGELYGVGKGMQGWRAILHEVWGSTSDQVTAKRAIKNWTESSAMKCHLRWCYLLVPSSRCASAEEEEGE